MRNQQLLKTIIKFWLIIVAALSAISCGGSGANNSGTFNLSQTNIDISGYQHSLSDSRHNINMTITGDGVAYAGAAYANGQVPVNWLSFEMTGSGNNYVLTVIVNPGYLSTGKSTAAFTVGTTDAKGKILATKVVTVSASLLVGLQPRVAQHAQFLTYGAVDNSFTYPLSFTADSSTNWLVSSNQSWITVDKPSGQGGATINAMIDTTQLTLGEHRAEITVRDTQVANNKFIFYYSLALGSPSFDFSGEDGLLGGDDGMAQDTLPITFTIGTGTYNHPYSLTFATSNGEAWLTSDEDSGVVNGTGKTLNIRSIAPDSMAGTYTATATLRITVGEVEFSRQLNITLNKEMSRMSLGAQAVSFSSAPDKSLLSRSIPVLNSLGRTDLTWQAESDQSWLTVTASGTMGQDVTLQADPTGLAADQTYFATVTVTPDDANDGSSEQIKVGFTVLSAVPTPQMIALPQVGFSQGSDEVFHAVNPLKPEIVIGYDNNLIVYNTNTAQQLYSIDSSNALILGITYAADGSKLFVYDGENRQIVSFDAESGAKLATYQLSNPYIQLGLLHVRQNGRNLLYGAPGKVIDTDSGDILPLSENVVLPSGRSLNAGYDPSQIVNAFGQIYHAYYSALNGGQLRSSLTQNTGYTSEYPRQACFEPTGTYIYTATDESNDFFGYNRLTNTVEKTLAGQPYPNAIVCAADGLIIGGTNAYFDQTDILVYSPDGKKLTMLNSATNETSYRRLLNRGLSVSSDAGQLIAVSERGSNNYMEVKFMRLPKAD